MLELFGLKEGFMVYKKYIKRNGKVYGPYLYHSTKKDGKVTTHYLGPHKNKKHTEKISHHVHKSHDSKRKRLILISFLSILSLALVINLALFVQWSPTGQISLDMQEVYVQGEQLNGHINLILKQGELIPYDSNLVIDNVGDNYEYPISELFNENLNEGNFYIEGQELQGNGQGFGIAGEKEVFVPVGFSFQVIDLVEKPIIPSGDGGSSGTSSSGTGENPIVPDKNDTETNETIVEPEIPDQNDTETNDTVIEPETPGDGGEVIEPEIPVEPPTETSVEETPTEEPEAPVETPTETTPSETPDSGDAIADTESASTSEGGDSSSDSGSSENSDAGSDSGSTESSASDSSSDSGSESSSDSASPITGEVIGDEVIEADVSKDTSYEYTIGEGKTVQILKSDQDVVFEIKNGKAIFTTDYSEFEKGFGEDYLTEDYAYFSVDLSQFEIPAKEGLLKTSFNYDNLELTSSEIYVVIETNETQGNQTFFNDTLQNMTEINVTAQNETNFTRAEIINSLIIEKGLNVNSKVIAKLIEFDKVRVIIRLKEGKNSFGKKLKGFDLEVLELDQNNLAQLIAEDIIEIIPDEKINLLLEDSEQIIKSQQSKNDFNLTGSGKNICIIDTGVDSSVVNYDLGFDFVNNDSDASDDQGHGTQVAYIAKTIAPESEILVAKVIDENGNGYESTVLEGLQWCIDNNANIVSFSIGAGLSEGYCDSNIVAELVNNAVDNGIFVSAATGNEGSSSLRVPSCASKATRVASTTKLDEIASFSNINGIVDLLSPGEAIKTKDIGGNDITVSGTSMSAPMIAGAAALVLENETLNPEDLKNRFKTTGKAVEYSNINFSRINVYNALINNITLGLTNYTANQTNLTINNGTEIIYEGLTTTYIWNGFVTVYTGNSFARQCVNVPFSPTINELNITNSEIAVYYNASHSNICELNITGTPSSAWDYFVLDDNRENQPNYWYNSFNFVNESRGYIYTFKLCSRGYGTVAHCDMSQLKLKIHGPEGYVNVTLQPENNHIFNSQNVKLNCSIDSFFSIANVSLYGNFSGNWHKNKTISFNPGSQANHFTTVIHENQSLTTTFKPNGGYGRDIGIAQGQQYDGIESSLYVTEPSGFTKFRGVIAFNVENIPSSAKITSAYLRIKKSNCVQYVSSDYINLYRIFANWSSTTANWTHANTTQTWAEGGSYASYPTISTANVDNVCSGAEDWLTFADQGLTSLVQNWTEGSRPNYGVILIGRTSADPLRIYLFTSNSYGDEPELVVTYNLTTQEDVVFNQTLPEGSYKWNCEGTDVFAHSNDSVLDYGFTVSSCLPPTNGNWVISQNCIVSNRNITMAENGNITILSGGSLTLDKANLFMNPKDVISSNIAVQNGGQMIIKSNSMITSNNSNNFLFRVNSGSNFSLTDSRIENIGTGSYYANIEGLSVSSNNALIINNTFRFNYHSLVLRASNITVSRNSFYYDNGSALTLGPGAVGNRINNNLNAFNTEGLLVEPTAVRNNLSNNLFVYNGIGAFMFESSYNVYINNSFDHNAEIYSPTGYPGIGRAGIIIMGTGFSGGFHSNVFKNNSIQYNNGSGISSFSNDYFSNLSFINNKVRHNKGEGFALGFSSSSGTNSVFEDCVFENNSAFDFKIGGINNTLLNTTFNKSAVNVSYGSLFVKWLVDVNVTSQGQKLENANVSLYNKTGEMLFTAQTNSEGLTSKYVLTEYMQNKTGDTNTLHYYTPHDLNVSWQFLEDFREVNVTNTTTLNINLDICNIREGYDVVIVGEVFCNKTDFNLGNQNNLDIAPGGSLTLNGISLIVKNINIAQGGLLDVENSKNSIIMNGELNLSGEFKMGNTTLHVNGTGANGNIGINVTSTGSLYIMNDSLVTNGNDTNYRYDFLVRNGANFILENSTIEYVGWSSNYDERGLEIYSQASQTTIRNSVLRNNYDGLVLRTREHYLDNIKFINNQRNGLRTDSNYQIINNSFFKGGSDAIYQEYGSGHCLFSNITFVNFSESAYDSSNNVPNVTFVNSNISHTGGPAIKFVSSSDSSVLNTSISNIQGNGILVSSLRTNLKNLNLTNLSGNGIYFSNAGSANLSNSFINDSFIGIYFYNYENDIFQNVSLENSDYGVWIKTTNNVTLQEFKFKSNIRAVYFESYESSKPLDTFVVDSKIETSSLYDVYLVRQNGNYNLNLTFINTTFDNSKIFLSCSPILCQFIPKWYLDVNVTNSTFSPILNANVSSRDKNDKFVFWNMTQNNGFTDRYALPEYIRNSSGTYMFTNYTLYANKSGYFNYSGQLNLTQSKVVNISLIEKTQYNICNPIPGADLVITTSVICLDDDLVVDSLNVTSTGILSLITSNLTSKNSIVYPGGRLRGSWFDKGMIKEGGRAGEASSSRTNIWQNGNLTIEGVLELVNSTLFFNGTGSQGRVGFNATQTSEIYIQNNSLITNGQNLSYRYFAVSQGDFLMDNSTLEYAGWNWSSGQRGLELNSLSNNIDINESTFQYNYDGLVLLSGNFNIGSLNIINNQRNGIGIYASNIGVFNSNFRNNSLGVGTFGVNSGLDIESSNFANNSVAINFSKQIDNSKINNCSFINQTYGAVKIYGPDSLLLVGNIVANNSFIKNKGDSILVSGFNNKIINNWINISFTWSYQGIQTDRAYYLIAINNTIFNTWGRGVDLLNSYNGSFYNNTLINCSRAFYFTNSTNNTIKGSYLDRNIYTFQSNTQNANYDLNNTIQDTIISNSSAYDLYISDQLGYPVFNQYVKFVNVSFNISKQHVTCVLNQGVCTLGINWYLDVNVTNSTIEPMEDANVVGGDRFNKTVIDTLSGSSGLIPTQILPERLIRSGDNSTSIWFSNYTLNVTKLSYASVVASINMNNNSFINISLFKEADFDTCYPSSYGTKLIITEPITCNDTTIMAKSVNVTEPNGNLTLINVTLITGETIVNENRIFRAFNCSGGLWQNSNVTVKGNFILDNSTLIFNGTNNNGSLGFNGTNTALLDINNSLITKGQNPSYRYGFILKEGSRFNLTNSIAEYSYGFSFFSNDALIKSNLIRYFLTDFTSFGDSVLFFNNTFYNNSFAGLRIDEGQNNFILNNTFTNNTYGAFMIFSLDFNPENNFFYGNNIFNNREAGISLYNFGFGNDFVQDRVYNNKYGFLEYEGYGLAFNHSFVDVFYNNSIQDFGFSGWGNEIINSTFNQSKTFANNVFSFEEYFVRWYLDVQTFAKDETKLSGVDVSIYNNTGILRFSESTNSSGQILRQNVTEYEEDTNGKNYVIPYQLNLSKSGYGNISYLLNLIGGTELNFTMNALPVVYNLNLSSSSGKNSSTDNLTIEYEFYDPDGEQVYLASDWRVNDTSICVLNAPFNTRVEGMGSFVKDYSTFKNHGMIGEGAKGPVGPVWTLDGRLGGAYEFDGDNDLISFENVEGLDLVSNFTIEAWIKPNMSHENGNNYGVMAKANSTVNPAWSWQLRFGGGDQGASDRLGFHFNEDGTLPGVWINVDQDLTIGQWYHVVGTHNGTHAAIYLNGLLKDVAVLDSVEISNTPILIGNEGWPSNYFNGTIDEVKVYNRTLSPEQINSSYFAGLNQEPVILMVNHETSLGDQWRVAIIPSDSFDDGEIMYSNGLNISNSPPNTEQIILNSSLGENRTTETINCYANISDQNDWQVYVNYTWYKNKVFYSEGQVFPVNINQVSLISSIAPIFTAKGENWTCSIKAYDGTDYENDWNNATLKILNTPPVVTLISPSDNATIYDRMPTFNYSGYDPDGDVLIYSFNATCFNLAGGECTDDYRFNYDTENYTVSEVLKYFIDNGYYYNWSVRAWESGPNGQVWGNWSVPFRLNIQALVSITLNNDTVDFGAMLPDEINDTTNNKPRPFYLENTGNCFVNVSINATDLFELAEAQNPSDYYQFKIDEIIQASAADPPAEPNSFDTSQSQMSWAQMPAYLGGNLDPDPIPVIVFLNWSNATDAAEIDLRVEVPTLEPPGQKQSYVWFEAKLGEG